MKAEREHVTLYIRNHSEDFKILVVENETDDSRYRITVDEEEDYLVVKAIIVNLYDSNEEYFNIAKIKSFLDTKPEIYRSNSYIIRNQGLLKSLRENNLF